MKPQKPQNGEEIGKALKYLHKDGDVFEISGIKPGKNKSSAFDGFASGNNSVVTGYFRDKRKAVESVAALDQVGCEAIYTTLNAVLPDLMGRGNHRICAGINRTKDDEVTGITNFLIDVDPVRPVGISSTKEELDAAMKTAKAIRDYLKDRGWPMALRAYSGNGAHLIYKVNLPMCQATADLLKKCLGAIGKQFATNTMKVDQIVFNPGRLVKLYGTMARKGDNIPNRPHRRAKICFIPEKAKIVPEQLLQELAAEATEQNPGEDAESESGNMLDVAAFLREFKVQFREPKRFRSATLFPLEKCLFNADHTPNEASIGQTDDGVLFYQCFHDSCKHHTWDDARSKISGNANISQFFKGNGASNVNGQAAKRLSIISVAEIAEKKITATPIINGLLDPKDQLLIFGAGGIKKSFLTLDVAFNLASQPSGGLWGMFGIASPVNTMFVQAENGIFNVKKRIDLMMKANPRFKEVAGRLSFLSSGDDCRVMGNLLDKSFQAALKEKIYQTATSVLVIDPLISFHSGDENDNVTMRRTLDSLTLLCEDTHTSAILVHAGKGGNAATSGGRGASAIGDWAPNILYLEPDAKEGGEILKVTHLKSRNYEKVAPFRLEFSASTGFRRVSSGKGDESLFLVVQALEQLGGKVGRQDQLMKHLAKSADMSPSTARRSIINAAKGGLIEPLSAGKHRGYRLTVDETPTIEAASILETPDSEPATDYTDKRSDDINSKVRPIRRKKKNK